MDIYHAYVGVYAHLYIFVCVCVDVRVCVCVCTYVFDITLIVGEREELPERAIERVRTR